jgi:hypothetical protein
MIDRDDVLNNDYDFYDVLNLIDRIAELKLMLESRTKEVDNWISKYDKSVTKQRVVISELEGDVSFYRCCALSGEIPDDLSSPSSVALQAKALKEQGSMRGTLADPNYDYDKKEYRKE